MSHILNYRQQINYWDDLMTLSDVQEKNFSPLIEELKTSTAISSQTIIIPDRLFTIYKKEEDNRPIDFENFKIDLSETIDSWIYKLLLTICNLIFQNKDWYLKSIYDAWVTPNNVVTFRGFVLNPIWMAIFLLWFISGLEGLQVIWVSIMGMACALDKTDWDLARNFKMKSKIWALVDAWVDKTQETSNSSLASINFWITWDYTLWIINWLLTFKKWIFHIISQFRPWRPDYKAQAEMWYNSALRDQNTVFTDEVTSWAANNDWKRKTFFQFLWSLWVLWTQAISALFDLWTIKDILNYLFTTSSGVSIWFAIKSIWPSFSIKEQTKRFFLTKRK